jgi:glucose-1-phosphate thymidylyltransferase
VFDKLAEVEDIGHVIISTNLRFEPQFREFLESNDKNGAEIIADRSSCEEDKPGAIASLAQIAPRINDSCLIIAGDNLFTSNLRPMIRAFRDKSCATVGLYDVGNRELAKQYSTAIMDPEGRIADFREKPDNPETTLIGTCIYILPQRTLKRLNEYLADAADRDNPGRFMAWLCKREPVYGHVLDGYWWDIGTIDQYNEASQKLERASELRQVAVDALESDRHTKGENVFKFEKESTRYIGVRHAVSTSSGTAALHVAVRRATFVHFEQC